jgi:hypothetical protein
MLENYVHIDFFFSRTRRIMPVATPIRASSIALFLSCLTTFGCGGSSDDSDDVAATQRGTLSVAITDAPVDNATAVYVQFTGVTVKPQQAEAIEHSFDSPLDVDLLALSGGESTLLLSAESVPAARVEWIELHVNAEIDNVFDSYVVEDSGGMAELGIPSDSQSGLRVVSEFIVNDDQNATFMIDWDLRKALSHPLGESEWIMRPALRVTDMSEYGSIAGTVPDGLLMDEMCDNNLATDVGNSIYVYSGHIDAPDDIGGFGVEPLTTTRVAQDMDAAGAYTYAATFLSPGDYTVALNCQGLREDPESDDDITLVQPTHTTVVDDEKSLVNFQSNLPADQELSCTSDTQCEEGFSCWHEIPRGPSAGIPGSREQPGWCVYNYFIRSTH